MAWRLLIDLREYMCMIWTCAFWRSRMVTWPSLPDCPLALSLVCNLEGETSNLCQLIWQSIYFKINYHCNGNNIWKQRETVSSLGTERWREVKRVLCYNALWWSPYDCVMWYVNKCCPRLSSTSLFIKPSWHFWCAFLQPMLTWPSEVAGIIPSVPGAITDKVIVS